MYDNIVKYLFHNLALSSYSSKTKHKINLISKMSG